MDNLKEKLELIYFKYNKKEYIDPDPLLFLYNYPEKKDREIGGFIAACCAYGRVEMIMKTVASILNILKPSPFEYLMIREKKDIAYDFKNFKYRFADNRQLTNLLWGIREVLDSFSSLENCFYEGGSAVDETTVEGLTFLYKHIIKKRESNYLFADPKKRSACKRSHLFLRWMVRNDSVDPGGWGKIDQSKLIIPLDTHMFKTGRMLGFTNRKTQDMKTALQITKGFKTICQKTL